MNGCRLATRHLALLLLFLAFPLMAGDLSVPDPGTRETCPVCGMFVARYPEWVATVVYNDGHAHHFDGAKDFFKYLFNLEKYAPKHQRKDIKAMAVTEYYGLKRIDATKAFFVTGSDVLGPMGHELVPLANRPDAEEFIRDHAGRRILTFSEVEPALLKKLDGDQHD